MRFVSIYILTLLVICCAANSNAQAIKKGISKKPASSVKPAVNKKPALAIAPIKIAGTRIKITTDSGVIVVLLYDKTPLHRDNFTKLVNNHFYDSLLFHRVIAGFMIQGGDPESKNAASDQHLGKGDVGYTIPAEFDSTLFHKKGALAAARTNNAQKASSGCQFYIVQGKKYTEEALSAIEQQRGLYFSPAKRKSYALVGGTPLLDMNYTVFGEVEVGLEVIDRIAQAQKNNFDRPIADIRMKLETLN